MPADNNLTYVLMQNGLPAAAARAIGDTISTGARPRFPKLAYLQKANWCFMDTTNPAFVANFTQHAQMTVEAPFIAVQVGVANGYTTGGPQTVKVAVSTMSSAGAANSTAPLNGSGTWVLAGNGGASLVVPAASVLSDAPGFAWGDIVPLASLDRTDGGTFPLLCVRVQNAAGNNLTGMVGATNAGTPFESETGTAAKGRLYRVRSQAVLGVDNTTLGVMNTTTPDQSYGPPVVIRYFLANGTGQTVTVFGDSLDCGYGQQGVGTSSWTWIREAVSQKSTLANPIEVCCLANSGFTMDSTARRVAALAQHCKGTAALLPLGTPNSVPNGVITQATLNTQAAAFAQAHKALTDQGIHTLVRTFAQATTAAKGWGTGDALRRALNSTRVNNATQVENVLDFAAANAGPTDGTGQQQPLFVEADGIHPSAQLAYVAAPLLTALL